jgi:hypothetical protein
MFDVPDRVAKKMTSPDRMLVLLVGGVEVVVVAGVVLMAVDVLVVVVVELVAVGSCVVVVVSMVVVATIPNG